MGQVLTVSQVIFAEEAKKDLKGRDARDVQQKLDDIERVKSLILEKNQALEAFSDTDSGNEDEEDQAEFRKLTRDRRSAE